ncbi:MAG TPA: TonB-dependent receptor [Bacteroidia bacterium]|nr:TonB-dependent receptor [Bacteroidia bacterium]
MKTTFGLFLFIMLLPVILLSQEDSSKNVTGLLDYSIEELMNLKVVSGSAAVSGQKLIEAPSTMLIITAEQIEERGYEELGDALRDVPGIDFIHLNGYAPTLIYFRGMYGAENLRALLMVDGIPENNIAGTSDMGGPAYSLHNVERIEIIWGPSSAVYGANAFGGMINIITKKGEKINGLQLQRGQGNMNTSFEKAAVGMKKGKFDITFSGSLFRTDGPVFKNRTPNYSSSYVDNAYSFFAAVGYTSGKCKAEIGYRMFDTPMGWGGILNSPTKFLKIPPQGNGNIGTVGIIAENFRGERPGRYEPFSRTGYMQNTYSINDKWSVFSLAEYRETGISEKSYTYITIDGTNMHRLPTARYCNRWGGKVSTTYAINKMHKVSLGVEFYQDNLEQGSRKINQDTNKYTVNGQFKVQGLYTTFAPRAFVIWNNFGSFLQYELHTKWLRETHFTAGTRFDVNSVYGNPLSPRIAIVNKPTEKLTFKLLYGAAYRAPTITEIEQFQSNLGTRKTLANSDLKPEKVRTYEVNIFYNPVKQVLLQLNAFRNELSDIIILTSLEVSNFTQNQNLGKAYVNGIEAKVDLSFSKRIAGFINFTLQDGKQTAKQFEKSDTTFTIPNIAKVKGNIGLTFRVEKLFNISIIGNWVGKREVLGSNPYGPVDGYFVTNIAITTHKFLQNHVYASFSVKNLFNVKYLDPGPRAADGLLYSTVLEQPGILGILKLGVSF